MQGAALRKGSGSALTEDQLDHETLLRRAELRAYFLDRFCDELARLDVYEFRAEKYAEVLQVIEIIIEQMENDGDCNAEDFYSVIQLCLQIYREGRAERVFSRIKTQYSFFYSFQRWQELFNNLLQRRKDNAETKQGFRRRIQLLLNKEQLMEKNANISLLVLEELNVLDFPSEVIVQLGKLSGVRAELLFNLLDRQESSKSVDHLVSQLRDRFSVRQHRAQKLAQHAATPASRLATVLRKALPYLAPRDSPHALLLLNRDLARELRRPVRRLLMLQPESVASRYRLRLWSDLDRSTLQYPQMKTEVALRMEPSHVEDQITMDVNR